MSTETIDGELTRTDNGTTGELKLAEVQAETERQDEQLATPAELAAMERQLKDGISEFRAEIEAVRESGILELHMPGGPEIRRRKALLAPLAQPQGWVPERPPEVPQPQVTPEQYMAAPDLPRRERRPSRSWWRRYALELTMAAGLVAVAAVVAAVSGVL